MKKIKDLVEKLLKEIPETAGIKPDEIMTELDEALAEGGGSEALQRQNKDFLKEIKTLKTRLKAEHGDDSARVSELEDQLSEIKVEYEEKLRKAVTEREVLSSKATRDAKKLQDELAKIQGAHTKSTIDRELTEALVKGNVGAEHLPALKALLGQGASVLIDGDVTKAMAGNKALAEYVGEFLAGDSGKFYVKAPGSSGGGASGSGNGKGGVGNNPWSKEHFDLTKQGQAIKRDPEQAKQMQIAAGVAQE